MKYEIVKYSPEFKSQVMELQTHLWSPDLAVNAAYLKWKYEQNPYLNTPPIYLALYEGKVVGMRGMYGAKWEIGHPSQTLPVLCAGDSVTAPEHRKRGLYKRITSAALNDLGKMGYTYVFSLSTGPITLPGSLAMGWRSIGSLQMLRWRQTRKKGISYNVQKYANKVPLLPSLSNFVRRQGSKLSVLSSAEKPDPFLSLDRNGERLLSKINPNVNVQQAPRSEEMAELVKRIIGDGRIRHVRDQQYFAWRFKDPLSQYRFLYWRDSSLDGYLVLQASIYRDRSRVSIVDWEAANTQVRADLLQASIHLGVFDVLTIWSATLPDEAKMLLRNTGFNYLEEARGIEASSRHAVLVRPVRDEMLKADWVLDNRRLLDLANWDLRMIYSDAY